MASDLLANVNPRTVQGSSRANLSSSAGKVAPEQTVRQAQDVSGRTLPAFDAKAATQTPVKTPADDPKQLAEDLKKVNDHIQTIQRDLEFSVDEDSHKTRITVRDSKSGDVIRTIPAEDLTNLAKQLNGVQGILVREKA